MSFLDSPLIHSFILYIIGLICLPLNLFGGYCILFQTPGYMKSVKLSMLNLHFWSCLSDLLFGVVVQPFTVIPVEYAVSLGLIRYVRVDFWVEGSITLVVLFCESLLVEVVKKSF
ncbi:hypothetical protein CAEBREN_23335 [Caenorhabditis brenneri]|uniref:Uncharacterized protein n=1 Tax=Caenorhabditis brenneri TaxID=135651 RepID=G0PKE0_CAEBE|nr:hypothetical protein CAEBREN_23335 [Caenorhabditis brenneri]